MTIFQALILGLVQGITEFLPVSSSGHLILFPEFFGWELQGYDFDVLIHVATLCAIFWVLREDLLGISKGFFSKRSTGEGVLGMKIFIATVPVVVAGLFIAGAFLDDLRNPTTVAVMLIVWGVVLWIADEVSKRYKRSTTAPARTTWQQAIIIGLFQMAALIPGSSRSGVTMSGGLFAGMNRETAARFSFLLAIPAVGGAAIFVLFDAIEVGFQTDFFPLLVGFAAAFFSGMISIRLLLAFLQKATFRSFALYRIVLGIVVLLIFL